MQKRTVLRCVKSPVLSPRSDKAHTKQRLQYQPVHQSPFFAFRRL